MWRRIVAFGFLFIILLFQGVFAESKSDNLILVESETELKGWRFHSHCSNSNDDINYEWTYYSPPPRKDLGGFGVVRVNIAGVELIYSGFDLYPHKKNSGCGSILGKNTLIFETEDWSASKRYVVSINVNQNTKVVYQYKLKKTLAYVDQISEDAYLVAGFGVCKKNVSGNWIYDLFCEDIDKVRLELAENNLEDKVGVRLSPSIPGVGEGAFRYYIICDKCSSPEMNDVDLYLSEYLADTVKKIKLIQDERDKIFFYNSLLAFESVSLIVPNLVDRILPRWALDKTDLSVVDEVEYKNYWKVIFNEN